MYKCIKNLNTEFGNFKVGDIVSDDLGKKYSQFEKMEDAKAPKAPKVELLVEAPAEVEVIIEDKIEETVEVETKANKRNKSK